MNDSDRKRQVDAVLMRMASYYQAELSKDVIELYHQALASYPVEDVKRACGEHIKSSKWFPKISELCELLKPHVPELESVADQQAALVVSMVSRCGYTSTPIWSDPITAHLFSQRFNWKSLCNTLTESETKWFIKEFKEAYKAAHDMCDGDLALLAPPPLEVHTLLEMVGKRIDYKPNRTEVQEFKRKVQALKKNSREELERQKQQILQEG